MYKNDDGPSKTEYKNLYAKNALVATCNPVTNSSKYNYVFPSEI
jgi:hypothetical protein